MRGLGANVRFRLSGLGLALAVAAVVAGCGTANGAKSDVASCAGRGWVLSGPYAPPGNAHWHKLASEMVPGGRVSVFGTYYSDPRHRGFELEAVEEEETQDRQYRCGGSGGGGAEVGPGKVLSLQVSRGCTGGHETVFLFGLLGRRHDTVIARRGASKTRLTTARIPASLHSGGVLVYGALGRDGAKIVARAPSGAVDEERSVINGQRVHCVAPKAA